MCLSSIDLLSCLSLILLISEANEYLIFLSLNIVRYSSLVDNARFCLFVEREVAIYSFLSWISIHYQIVLMIHTVVDKY